MPYLASASAPIADSLPCHAEQFAISCLQLAVSFLIPLPEYSLQHPSPENHLHSFQNLALICNIQTPP